MVFERHVDVDWKGSVMEGQGEAKAGSGAFSLPVTFPSRIGEHGGKTSPEELMAAAHAACYAMALNGTLGRKGASADRTLVTATISADEDQSALELEQDRRRRRRSWSRRRRGSPREQAAREGGG